MSLLAVAVGMGMAPAGEPGHPCLIFATRDLPALRTRMADPATAPAWESCLAQARAVVASAVVPQAPAEVGTDPAAARAAMLFGHKVGRELTRWMETLGIAYQITGDREFADPGGQLLTAVASAFPVTQPWMAKGFAGGRGDVMRGLALGYDLFHDVLSPEQRHLVRVAADGYVANFLAEAQNPKTWWYGVHNFNGVCGGGAGMLCLVLRDQDPEAYGRRLESCVAVLTRWLDTSFDPEGAYSEGVGYSQYGLANTLLFARALKRSGGTDLFARPRLRQASRFYAMSLLPGEAVMDARNDSMYASAGLECLLLAEQNQDGLARWLYQRGGAPALPWELLLDPSVAPQAPAQAGVPRATHFTGRGLAVWRTGWEREDWCFSIEAGPYYPITHNQADKGHFTFYGGGYRWAVDPGYGNDRQAELSRCHTLAHNCVLVDGHGQAPSGCGLGTDGRILLYEDRPDYGYAIADCTAAYNANTRGMPGPGVAYARRHAFFVRPQADGIPPYAVILDDITKDHAPHEFTWQMLTWPSMATAARGNGFLLRPRSTLSGAWLTTPGTALGKGTCAWTLDLPKTQTYRLWARVRAAGVEPARSDSFTVRVGQAPAVEWHMPGNREWTWGAVGHGPRSEERLFELEAGPCQIVFETREPDAHLDAAVLLPVAEAAPTDGSVPEASLLKAGDARVAAPMTRVPDPAAPLRLAVILDATAPMRYSVDHYEPADGRQPSSLPRLRAAVTAPNPRFVAVLAPLPGPTPEPAVETERSPATTTVRVRWGGTRDTFTWRHGDPGEAVFQRSLP